MNKNKLIFFFFIITTLILILIFTFKDVTSNDINIKNGIVYQNNSGEKYTGEIIDRYSLWGQKKFIGSFKYGEPVGEHIRYYENGDIKSFKNYYKGSLKTVANFKKGSILHGFFEQYNKIGTYYNGNKVGLFREYSDNKDFLEYESIFFIGNNFPTEVIFYNKNTYLESSEYLLKNKSIETNIFKTYYKNGQLKKLETCLVPKDNSSLPLHSYFKKLQAEYYNNGNLKTEIITDTDTTFEANQYYENGNLSAITKNNKNEYVRTTFFENGEFKYIYKTDHKLSTTNIKNYFENSQLRYELNLKNNNIDGEFKMYYENGQLKFKGIANNTAFDKVLESFIDSKHSNSLQSLIDPNYTENNLYLKLVEAKSLITNSKSFDEFLEKGEFLENAYEKNLLFLDGPKISYYSNGQLKTHKFYKDGQLDGSSKEYYNDGQLKYEEFYKDGKANNERDTPTSEFENQIIRKSVPYINSSEYNSILDKDILTQIINYKDGSLKYKFIFDLVKKEASITEYYKNGQTRFIMLFKDSDWDILFQRFEKDKTLKIASYKDFIRNSDISPDYWNSPNYFIKKTYFANGQLREESTKFSTKFYFANGKIESEIYYNHDSSIKSFSEYFINGNLKTLQTFSASKNNKSKSYREYASYFGSIHGVEDGNWKAYSSNGNLILNIFYKDGIRVGIWKTFYTNGKLKSETTFKDGTTFGTGKSYFINGTLKTLVNYENPNSFYYEYYDNGNLKQSCNYKNGKLNGHLKYFYKNGNLERSEEYKNGKLHGSLKYYSENNDLLFEQNYKDGYIHGIKKLFHSNLQLLAEGNIENNKYEGSWQFFYPDGTLGIVGDFKNDIQVGDWYFFSPNGKLKQIINYDEFTDTSLY